MHQSNFSKIKAKSLSLSQDFFKSFRELNLSQKDTQKTFIADDSFFKKLKDELEKQTTNQIHFMPFLPEPETAALTLKNFPKNKFIYLEQKNSKALNFFNNTKSLNLLNAIENFAYLGGSFYPEILQHLADYKFLFEETPKIVRLIEKFKNHRILIFGSGTYNGHGLTSRELYLNLKRLGLNVEFLSLWKLANENAFNGVNPELFLKEKSEEISKLETIQKVIAGKISQFDPDIFFAISGVYFGKEIKTSLEKSYCPLIFWDVEDFESSNYKDLETFIDCYGSYQKHALDKVSCPQSFFLKQGFFYPEQINENFQYPNPKSLYFCGLITETRAQTLCELIKKEIDFDLFGVWLPQVAQKYPQLEAKFLNNPRKFIAREDYYAIIKKGNIALNFCDHNAANPRFFEVPAFAKIQLPSKIQDANPGQDFFNNSEEILDFLNKETEYFNGLKTNGFDAGLQESYGFKFLEAIQSLGF